MTKSMSSTTTTILAVAFLAAVATAFSGEGTFYGAGGAGKSGACMLNPGFNGVGLTVAMNGDQFENGMSCGKCVMITGTGSGLGMTPILGPIYATIDNKCPECKFGDVDLGLGGDGRWQINWDFIDCGAARSSGSNLPNRNQRSLLRGSSDEAVTTTYLAPGEMVTKEGIVKITDYLAASAQEEAKLKADAAPIKNGTD